MAECYIIDSPAVALTAATAKTVLSATAGSTQPFRPVLFSVAVDATSTGLLKVEYLVSPIASTTGGSSVAGPNIARMNDSAANKSPVTAAALYASKPNYTKNANNGGLAIKTTIIPLPATPFEIEYPLGREFYCPESNIFGIRLTATTVSPNAYTSLAIEE